MWATLAFAALLAQPEQTFTYDWEGRRIPLPISLNGRQVNTEKIEEKVLEDTPSRKVIERMILTAAPDGGKGQPVKIVIEENKAGDGSVTREEKTYRGDLNGRLNLYERVMSQTRPAGSGVTETETTVSRESVNGVEVVEKRSGTTTVSGNVSQEDVMTYRKDSSGGFRPAVRVVTERKKESENKTVENRTEYQTANSSGRLEPSSQRVVTEEKVPGGVRKLVDWFGMAQAGQVSSQGQLKLREQQVIEQRVEGGRTLETFSIRRPNLEGRLPDRYTKISERVCEGKCAGQ